MVFSSAIFLFQFFPLFIVLYLITPYKFKNYTALIASLFFYFWGGPQFILLLLFSISVDYFVVNYFTTSTNLYHRKIAFYIGLAFNVLVLIYFKYSNFFVGNVNLLLENFDISLEWTNVILPIGISFFTFQKMSYLIDVYRNNYKPLEKWTDYALYIMLFPQLIAGPIVRYKDIDTQIVDRKRNLTSENMLNGMIRFSVGLAKKVLIANAMGWIANHYLADIEALNFYLSWLVMGAYTLQIYFDFSGYSDMAIGIGLILGFKFPENFNAPYTATSITEFWKKWHITLSNWMKDYLYIPLGGNRVSTSKMYMNLMFVFLISGFWHGASWNFILWGAFHGLFLILDRIFLIQLFAKIGRFTSMLITFFIVLLGWTIFRMENISDLQLLLGKMFQIPSFEVFGFHKFDREFYFVFVLGFLISFLPFFTQKPMNWLYFSTSKSSFIYRSILAFLLLVLSFSELMTTEFNPFIYFKF